jgi:hypothetical protein
MFLFFSQLRDGPAAIQTFSPLGDYALKTEIGGSLEEFETITLGMVAELDG